MTSVTFETAAFASAIKKAASVAPSKGAAFDKAAGLVIDLAPDTAAPAIVRATNLDVFSMEWLNVISCEGEPTSWRLPSTLLAQVTGSLPIGTDKTVTLESKTNAQGFTQVHLTQGRTKARFNMMEVSYYPVWSVFDPSVCSPVKDFGGRLAQVEWAAAKADAPLSGVHLTGETAVCTDKYRVASTDLSIPHLGEPITVPAGILSQVLKRTGDIGIGIENGQLLVMPDEYTQVRAICYDMPFVKYERVQRRVYEDQIVFRKAAILEVIARASSFSDGDRNAVLRVFIGNGEFAVMMENNEVGLLGDVVDLGSQCPHKRVEFFFTPRYLMESLGACPSEEVTLFYDKEKTKSAVYIGGGSGYEAWVMPRASSAPDPNG